MPTSRARLAFAVLCVLGSAPPVLSHGLPAQGGGNHCAFWGGGNTDIIARIIVQRLGEVFGQQFLGRSKAD